MAVFFDLDGPILDVSEKYYRIYCNLLTLKNKEILTKFDYWNFKRNQTPEREILSKTDSIEIYDWYRHERIRIIEMNEYLRFDRLTPGAITVLENLSKSKELILVTLRRNKEQLINQLAGFGLEKYFKFILSAPGNSNPKWRIKYDLILNNYGNPEVGSIFIGDTETDILTGKNLGIKTIAVTKGIRTKEILMQFNPDHLINEIKELDDLKL